MHVLRHMDACASPSDLLPPTVDASRKSTDLYGYVVHSTRGQRSIRRGPRTDHVEYRTDALSSDPANTQSISDRTPGSRDNSRQLALMLLSWAREDAMRVGDDRSALRVRQIDCKASKTILFLDDSCLKPAGELSTQRNNVFES